MRAVRAYAPGRTELAGNHTDHQGGRVIAGAVSCGIQMAVSENGLDCARIASAGFASFEVDLRSDVPRESERLSTAALVRGVVAGLRAHGVRVGGFDVTATSTIPSGGGLSSSAAFELALGTALVELFGAGCLDAADHADARAIALARIGQAAERDYFGKPCGLMDQLAVALGGMVGIDFADEDHPGIQRLNFDFAQQGYALCLVDTHCDHSRYTHEYAQVADDMRAVARHMGASRLAQVEESAFMNRFEEVRAQLGDLAALRGLHYYNEMRLVAERARALRAGDVDAFLRATRASGSSSAQYLQNVATADRTGQPAMGALALAGWQLQGGGAVRIHGGGFGGTIQAFVPLDRVDAFTCAMDEHLGQGSCRVYEVGGKGAHAVFGG